VPQCFAAGSIVLRDAARKTVAGIPTRVVGKSTTCARFFEDQLG
jgi:hypothetical protein